MYRYVATAEICFAYNLLFDFNYSQKYIFYFICKFKKMSRFYGEDHYILLTSLTTAPHGLLDKKYQFFN